MLGAKQEADVRHWVSTFRDAGGTQRIETQVVNGDVDAALRKAISILERANDKGVTLYARVEGLNFKSPIYDLTIARSRVQLDLGIS